EAILVVHRSDGSGTTNAFTTYLDKVSPEWHTKVGAGKEVKWPVGQGAQGNDGVAGGVKNTAGAVGYVELQYAAQAKLTSALVKDLGFAPLPAEVQQKALAELHKITSGGSPIWP